MLRIFKRIFAMREALRKGAQGRTSQEVTPARSMHVLRRALIALDRLNKFNQSAQRRGVHGMTVENSCRKLFMQYCKSKFIYHHESNTAVFSADGCYSSIMIFFTPCRRIRLISSFRDRLVSADSFSRSARISSRMRTVMSFVPSSPRFLIFKG